MKITAKTLSPLIPYIAVTIGMYCLSSAWVAIGLYHLGMAAVVFKYRDKRPTNQTAKAKAPLVCLALLVYSAAGVAIYLLWPYLGPTNSTIAGKLQALGINQRSWPYFAVYFCIANSILEELFWRGVLGSSHSALTPNDLLFGGYHALVLAAFVSPMWVGVVFIACVFAGWLWRIQRTATGGLLLPILTHLLADVGIVTAVHLRLFA